MKVYVNAINDYIGMDHWAVSTLTAMNRPGNSYYIDLNSWAGDLIQLLGICDNKGFDFTANELSTLIGCTDEQAIERGFTNTESSTASQKTGFERQDLYQDIDAIVLADDLKTTPIYTVFDNYYNNGGDDNRISLFTQKVIANNSHIVSGATTEEKLQYIARQYVAKEVPGIKQPLLTFF